MTVKSKASAQRLLGAVIIAALTSLGQATCFAHYLQLANSTAVGDGSQGIADGLDIPAITAWLVALVGVSLIGVSLSTRIAQLSQFLLVGMVLLVVESIAGGVLWTQLPGRTDSRFLMLPPVLVTSTLVALMIVPRRRHFVRPSARDKRRRELLKSRRRGMV